MRRLEARQALQDLLSQHHIENAAREAEWLILETLGLNAFELQAHGEIELTSLEQQSLCERGQRRARGEPLSYILGTQPFYKYSFRVTPAVLIPRPETEMIIEAVFARPRQKDLADLGCGSGCIGLTLLAEWPASYLWTCDVSSSAISVARENAQALGVGDRVEWNHGSVIDFAIENRFDYITANPPYIEPSDTRLEDAVRQFEPPQALFAEDRGLQYYREWIPWCYRALKAQGQIFFELGEGQAPAVTTIAQAAGFTGIEVKKDLAGIQRTLIATKDEHNG